MGQHDNNHHNNHDDNDPTQKQGQAQANLQGQIQGQANLQGQLQGQGQGQGQGQDQTQTAAQSLYSSSDNWNGNANGNLNGNGNWNGNGNENDNSNDNSNSNSNSNSVDNSLDNGVCNNLENSIENTVDNHVNTCVNVAVNVDLALDSIPSGPVIDLHGLNNIYDSLIMPDVVNQTMNNGNQFNIDQVNNLVDNDTLNNPSVNFNAGGGGSDWCDPCDPSSGGGSFSMDAHVHGGTATGGALGAIDHASSGISASADSAVNQSAFNQTITMGANIQFNSQTITAGHDFTDDHHTG